MLIRHGFFLLLLFWIPFTNLQGQADSILHLAKEIQGEALWRWYDANQLKDTSWLYRKLDEIVTVFQKKGATELARDTWVLKVFATTTHHFIYDSASIDRVDIAIDDARHKGWKIQEITLLAHKGSLLFVQGKIVAGFANMISSYEMMSDLGFDQFSGAKGILLNIGHAYLTIGDYDHAIQYMRESLSIPVQIPDPVFELGLMNTVGVCYMRMTEYDSAEVFFKKANHAATVINHTFWKALTNGNLGYIYFKKGEDDLALPLMEKDFEESLQANQTGSALNAALSLATIYLKKGKSARAEFFIRFSEEHVDRNDDNAMATFYSNLYAYSKLKGEYKQATAYADSSKVYRERYLANQDQSILEKAKLHLEMEKHAGELMFLEAARKRQVLMRNGLLAMLAMSSIIGYLLINRNYLKRKRELEMAHNELHHYTNAIREKNELIDSFSHEIERMREVGIQHDDKRAEHLEQLLHVNILTDEDWKKFKSLFDKVHPGFFSRLKEKMADLTQAEIRLLALTKLELAPREMASMLGVSYESIKKSRQRLRKKINLPEEGSLAELVDMI